MRKDHIFPYKIPEYKNHCYVKEDCWKDVDEELFAKLEKELGWHTLIRAKMKSTSTSSDCCNSNSNSNSNSNNDDNEKRNSNTNTDNKKRECYCCSQRDDR